MLGKKPSKKKLVRSFRGFFGFGVTEFKTFFFLLKIGVFSALKFLAAKLRKKELSRLRSVYMWATALYGILSIAPDLSTAITFIIYGLLYPVPDISVLFTSLNLLDQVRMKRRREVVKKIIFGIFHLLFY
jgi:hypothetical protein